MPVDAAVLDQYINEVAGDDAELKQMLSDRLGKNQNAAAKFTGGFLGRSDVTRKQQEVADQRKSFETEKQQYETRLLEAESEKDKIMRDLAGERISAAKAKTLLNHVKQAYSLTDADLPGIEDLKETVRTGVPTDSSVDIDKRLEKFKTDLMKQFNDQLLPEISSLAYIPAIWSELAHEHQELFGKRITKSEQQEVLTEARKSGKSIESVWEDKYGVVNKRLEHRDSENEKKFRLKWDDEQAKANQKAALEGVRPQSDDFGLSDRQSPIFKRSFAPKEEPAPSNDGKQQPPPRENATTSDASRERMGGAERAAAKFLERSRSGQLGQPIQPARKAS